MKKNPAVFIIAAALIIFSLVSAVCCTAGNAGQDKGGEVLKAFNLRMSGKADQAKELLENIIRKDSTNAMAYYELARLQQYMLIGGGKVKIEDIMNSADKAVKYDPKNVTYAYYKGISCFFNAFMAMEGDQAKVKERIAITCQAFENVLKLKPGYSEAMMYLVEIYGMLPADMGGDSVKAVAYAGKLAKINRFYGAKAKAALMPEGSDLVKYWSNQQAANLKNQDYLVELGKAYLFKDDPLNAEKCFGKAMKADPSKNTLILDLGRFHMMKVMQNKELAATELPLAKKQIEAYLGSKPEPPVPLKSYAMGLLARIEMFQGNQAEGDKLMAETKALDPYFSRASGLPTLLLFDKPDQVSHHYFSFFSPF